MTTLWRGIALLAVCAGIGHAAYVFAYPYAIMRGTMAGIAQRAGGPNRAFVAKLPDETSRGVVKPGPDLLYAICVFDLTAGPVEITATPSRDYWSVAFYAANSDNFFVLNDRQAAGKPVRLVLSKAGFKTDTRPQSAPDDTRFVDSPSTRGIVLFRHLVLDPADQSDAQTAAKTATCRSQ